MTKKLFWDFGTKNSLFHYKFNHIFLSRLQWPEEAVPTRTSANLDIAILFTIITQ